MGSISAPSPRTKLAQVSSEHVIRSQSLLSDAEQAASSDHCMYLVAKAQVHATIAVATATLAACP